VPSAGPSDDTLPSLGPPIAGGRRRGETIGRFIIVDVLGQGAMGVVVAAYDPKLDRKVAIKLVRPGASALVSPEEWRARLMREAQAMARVSHPNVVAIYEAGIEDREHEVFIAMEFIDGETLGAWTRRERRSWREIVAMYRFAGRGLAAAHAAGLVHRDFKPENVLVNRDGRVCVSDFGIVGVAAGDESAARAAGVPAPSAFTATLTHAESLIGTPIYMAPEQHLRRRVDARADQFAFCVALYEALYGERPFAGDTYTTLVDEVTNGRVRPAPRGADVPPWIRAIILRGLEVDPAKRFGSMEELGAALGSDPTLRRRRNLLVAGVVLVGLVSGGLVVRRALTTPAAPRVIDPCAHAADELAGIWDDPLRAAVRQSFAATKRPYAEDTALRVTTILDGYAGQWAAAKERTCRANVRGEESSALGDLRMLCLARHRAELGALTAILAKGDADVVDHAVEAAEGLGDLAACDDKAALLAAYPPPDDDATRGALETLRAKLAQAVALDRAGKSADGVALAKTLVDDARRLAYPPALAEAVYTLGHLEKDAGDAGSEVATKDALGDAAAARDDRLIAQAQLDLVWETAHFSTHPADALALRPFVEAAVARVGDDPSLQASLHSVMGGLLYVTGAYEQARAETEQALALTRKAHGADHPDEARELFNLGLMADAQGKYAEARDYHQRALDLFGKTLGPEHPENAEVLSSIAITLAQEGKFQEAVDTQKKAIAIAENADDRADLANALQGMGGEESSLGHYDDARTHLERALAIQEERLGHEHPDLASILGALGQVAQGQHRHDEAKAYFERAIAIREKALGPEHPFVAQSLISLANLYMAESKYADALPLVQRAIAITEASVGKTHPRLGYYLTALGICLIRTAHAVDAIAPLERALEIRTTAKIVDPTELARTRYILARALWDSRRDRTRALALAADAKAAPNTNAAQLAPIEKWWNERGP
jgi:serine/threonine-protein kinase